MAQAVTGVTLRKLAKEGGEGGEGMLYVSGWENGYVNIKYDVKAKGKNRKMYSEAVSKGNRKITSVGGGADDTKKQQQQAASTTSTGRGEGQGVGVVGQSAAMNEPPIYSDNLVNKSASVGVHMDTTLEGAVGGVINQPQQQQRIDAGNQQQRHH